MNFFIAVLVLILFFVGLVIDQLNTRFEIYENDILVETIHNDYETAKIIFDICNRYNKDGKKIKMKTKLYF